MSEWLGKRVGQYLIAAELGHGGAARVYKAYQPSLERYVALKFIRSDIAIDDPEAFAREARLLARLSHPNIVHIYDVGEEEGRPYLAMEYISGRTLRDWLAEERMLSLERALPILRQVGAALDHAHGQGIVHRDVKPANVFLTPDGRALLGDFGISKLLGPEGRVTQTDTTTGTPAYMSPEQVAPEVGEIGPWSDVYSLGAMVYEMLTGELPFGGETPLQAIVKRLREPPLPPRTHNPDLSEAVEDVILKALAREPAGRYGSAGELVDALAQAEPDLFPVARAEREAIPAWWPAAEEEAGPAPGEPPYRGLQAFDVADAELFYGREALDERLVDRLEGGERFLAIVGASGSGKSSLVRAGLVATLRERTDWEVHIITPTAHPLEALAVALIPDTDPVRAATTLVDDLAADARSLRMYVRRSLRASLDMRLLLVTDQFEELFTLCRDPAERQAFVDNLLTATGGTTGQTVVVITLRADFYHHCAQYEGLRDALAKHQEYIGPMTAEEMRRAIEEPAQRNGWELEPGLADLMLRDVGEEPGALPLLSHALLETWVRRRGHTLTLGGYAESGGVGGAIAKTAEAVYQGLSEKERTIARNVFLRLTELGEGTQDTRRRAATSELVSHPAEADAVSAVIRTLADARLITTERETVQVAHEALIREWPTLREWLEEDREGLRLHRHLTESAQEWRRLECDPGELYRGARLAQALEWATAHDAELNPLEREYLAASEERIRRQEAERDAQRQRELEQARALAESQKQRAEEQAQSASRLRKRAIYLALALAVALLGAIAAGVFGNQARRQAGVALANKLAAESLTLLEEELDLALLLAVQAYDTLDTVQTRSSLLSALQYSPGLVHLLRGHSGGVLSVAYSPDGQIVASGSGDGTVRLWDAGTGHPVTTLTGHTSEVVSVAYSPDGRVLASCGREQAVQQVDEPLDNAIFLWDVESGRPIGQPLAGYPGYLNALAYSPDGRVLASGGCSEPQQEIEETDLDRGCTQGQILLWDVETGQRIGLPFTDHARAVKDLAFSPDGLSLASASCGETLGDIGCSQGEIVLWSVETGQAIGPPIAGHGDWVWSLAYSPDGKILASGSEDATVRLWDVSTALAPSAAQGLETGPGDQAPPAQPIGRPLVGHAVSVESVAFSPDGRTLASGGGDHTIRLWDVATGQPVGPPIAGHTARVTSVAFSPDGKALVSGGGPPDNTVRLWDPAVGGSVSSLFATYPERFVGVAFSPDGRILAAGCYREGYTDSEGLGRGGLLHVWSVADGPSFGQRIVEPIVASDASWVAVVDTAFSPDGSILATSAVADKSIQLWDTGTWQPIGEPLTGHADWTSSPAFSPDGRILATGDWGGTIRLWDVASRQPIGEPLTGHTWIAYVLRFTPDGETLVSSSSDGTVRLWDMREGPSFGQPIGEPLTAPSAVLGMALSPDGRTVATGLGFGGTDIILWDLETRQPIGPPLTGHTVNAGWLVFSPDGRTLASAGGSPDNTVRLWDVGTGRGIGGPLIGHTDTPIVIALSPDGKTLASSGWDGTIRLWDMEPESWKARVCQIAGRNMTPEEWAQYLPGQPYERTCPQWPEEQ